MSIFAALEVYRDDASRSAAMNMAIDEGLLEMATAPSIRFYRWDHPALSFGYFGKFSDVANLASERDLVRRWTGGGIVFHGDDLTYSIVIPANDSLFAESSMSIYAVTHRAIQAALSASGQNAEIASHESPKISEACFANAVRADVLVNGQKVAGAAQRRTRRGLLQQGSIQNVDLAEDFPERFAQELSAKRIAQEVNGSLLDRAGEIAANRYGTTVWLQRR
jgi:lipoate-protein ligase A